LNRKVWRHVPKGAEPLHVGYILKASGRWNRGGEYGCLYTSFSKSGARSEYRKLMERTGTGGVLAPRDLVSIRVGLARVADLTDPASSPVSPASEFLIGDDDAGLEQCRLLADYLRGQGYGGLIVPSAAEAGTKNLVIYIDGPAGEVELRDGGDREPI